MNSPFDQDIVKWVWNEKYRFGGEATIQESHARVVRGVYANDDAKHADRALQSMELGLWMPAGRIHRGAGTPNVVTMINCYVMNTIPDHMTGIADVLKDSMLTMQQGGGIGVDFSTLRPSGAYLKRTGSKASGPLPFMDMWNSMCATIMSAGSRRGAMMATMSCTHPDLIKFITAKQEEGRLTNFNISVLVTDAFMSAVRNDETWFLGHEEPPTSDNHLFVVERDDDTDWYAYEEWNARELWDLIIKNTYEYSEPGVIFIDRVNDWNNLNYMEEIACTNPCGEQPLPPYGACNLGAVNLARMVDKPFRKDAEFNVDLLKETVHIGVRFLDNVIDVTHYPLEEQEKAEKHSRRIGLGISGLGNALQMLGVKYGSQKALAMTENIMRTIKEEAYRASALLAAERGSFPGFDITKWGINSPTVGSLPSDVTKLIMEYGIRNGVLTTIAPTGTTSLYYGNISSGIEPTFLRTAKRKVLQQDNTYKEFTVHDYGYLTFREVTQWAGDALPDYMVTYEDLSVEDHLRIQAVCQKHIDSSISKTINCPKDMSLEEFQLVYWDAYQLGCKGCTTYRPSDIRGAVLSSVDEPEDGMPDLMERPKSLIGKTYKVKWPTIDSSFYVTINDHPDTNRPYEIFISSTSARYSEWTSALTLMISAIMRKAEDIAFIPQELKKVVSATETAWIGGKYYTSIVALIGDVIESHIVKSEPPESDGQKADLEWADEQNPQNMVHGEICPQCSSPTLIRKEGCESCLSCDYNKCQ